MFFEFPGILITIGVALLLISIIIIIVAYRSDVKDVDASKLSTNNKNQKDDDINQPEVKTEEKEIKIEEPKKDEKDLEKTKIFKPAEIMLEEKDISKDNKEERPRGLKDLLEDINKVDEKKSNEKIETIDIFNEEFDKEIKIEDLKKEEKEETKQPEIKSETEDNEDIELL